MSNDKSSHGFGLGVFGLLLLATALLVMYYVSNPVFAALLGLLSAITASAAYLEARRANGPKKFAITVLLLAILGTFLILVKAGLSESSDHVEIIENKQEELFLDQDNKDKRAEDLEKKLEKLEENR